MFQFQLIQAWKVEKLAIKREMPVIFSEEWDCQIQFWKFGII
jgi:hypothetical protein